MKKTYISLIVLFSFLKIGTASGYPTFSYFTITKLSYSPVLDASGRVIKVPGCSNAVKVVFTCTREAGEKINFNVDLVLTDANDNYITKVGASGSVKRVLYTDFGSQYTRTFEYVEYLGSGSDTDQYYGNPGWKIRGRVYYDIGPSVNVGSAYLGVFTQKPGDTFANAYNLGTLGSCSHVNATFVSTYASDCYSNQVGEPSADVFYKFTLSTSANIRISTCAEWYQNLLVFNSNQQQVAASLYGANCDNGGNEIITTLSAGTYYFSVEGFGTATGYFSPFVQTGGYNCRIAMSGNRDTKKNKLPESALEFYPNPVVNGSLTIKTPQIEASSSFIQIFDLQGSVVKKLSSDKETTMLNLKGLANGLYIIEVRQGKKITRKKLRFLINLT